MSGRLAQFTPTQPAPPERWSPSWNIAPGRRLLILRKVSGSMECAEVLWNLTPDWLRDLSRASFSANAENLAERPMFRSALSERRCLIPVDGFFLWQQQGQRKQPWYLRRRSGTLAIAGLWERYQLDDGTQWDSCALITAPAKGLAARIGSRMPVTLNAGEQAMWLASATAVSALQPLLLNAESRVEMMHPVATSVGNPNAAGAQCCTPTGQIVLASQPA